MMSQIKNSFNSDDNIQAAMFADCLANSKEIFQLIDAVFPLDLCHQYQVLPLKLSGNDLSLGLIDPNNQESLKFINSIAKAFKYNVELKLIDTQTHQIILASYPQNKQQPNRQKGDYDKTIYDKTIIDDSLNPNASITSENSQTRNLTDSAPTIISQPESPSLQTQLNSSEVLQDLPSDLDLFQDWNLNEESQPQPNKPTDSLATLFENPAALIKKQHSINPEDRLTIIDNNDLSELSALEQSFQKPQILDLVAETPVNSQEIPEVPTAAADFLAKLQPQFSWHKLLEQALEHRIDQLNLIQYSDYGSIIASQNNITQSALDQVPLTVFYSVIDEIKGMARLPRDSKAHPRKVVFEKQYEQERILLRLEFMLQDQQESIEQKDIIIVQILRDEAMKIYEQQQMDKISERALNLARELEKTLRKIQACFDSADFTNLNELQTVQSRINHQLEILSQ